MSGLSLTTNSVEDEWVNGFVALGSGPNSDTNI